MKAAEAMTRKVICIQPDDSLEDAYALMTEWSIRHLPVIAQGAVVGILSDRDVLRFMRIEDGVERVPPMPVSSAMSKNPYHCAPSSSISYVAGLMVDHKIDSLPVLDPEGALVGLLTSTDLLELLRKKDGEHKVLPFRFEIHSDVIRRRASA